MAEFFDYRLGRVADIRLPEGANFSADFTFTGIDLTGYVATLAARRASNGGKVPFTWSKSGLTVGANAISFDITQSTTDDAGKAFSTVTARGATDYALTIRQSGGGPIVMRLQGTVAWVDDVGDFDTGTAGSNQVSVIVGSGTSVSVAVTNAGHPAVTVADSSSVDLTLTGQQLTAAAIFGTTSGTVCQGNDARLSDSRTPTAHASSHVTGGSDKIRDASASQDGLMTSAQASKLDGIAAGANNYSLPVATTTTIGGVKRNTGSAGQYVSGIDSDGALQYGTPSGGGGGSGDVVGPASSVDNRIPIFVGTGGKTIEDSGVTLTPAFAGTSEVFTIDFSPVTNVSDYYGIGWLVIHDDAGSVGLWWRESTQANSAPVGLIADRLIQINITIPPSNENQYIATETAAALDADSAFSASASGTVVTCTVTAPAAITGSFSSGIYGLDAACSVTTEGADPSIAAISQIDGSAIEDIDHLKIDATGTTDSTTFLRGDGTWAVPDYPPSLTDGNKGDISVIFSGTSWVINDRAVALQRMADMATASLLGRNTAGTGAPEVLSASTARSLLNVADGANNYSHPNHTGDVTSTGDGATTIANDAVTYAKIQNVTATDRILGRDSAGAGDVEELSVSGGIEFTGSGGIQTSAFTGDVTKSSGGTSTTIANDAVTYAKLQNVSATSRVLGRKGAGAGDAEECSLSEILDFVGSAAQGDILYRGASGWERLGAGTSGRFLRTNGAAANPSWNAVPVETAVITSNYTDSTGTLGNVTGMSFSLAANERVTAILSGFWGTQTTNSGFRYDFTCTQSVSYVLYNVAHGTTQTAFRSGDGATAFSTAFVETTGNANLYLPITIHLHVVNGATPATVQLRMGGETSGVTFTLYQGFTLQLFRF